MKIEVSLYSTLRRHLPDPTQGFHQILEADAGATVREILEKLRVPRQEVHLVFINGAHADVDTTLEDGNRLGLFPAVGGG